MSNLTTRKIVLGLLVTLVLAFSVPSVVDAIVDPEINESDLNPTDLYNVGGTATISSITITPDKAGSRETVSIRKTSGITLTGDFYGLSSVSLEEVDENLTDTTEGTSFTYTRDGRTQTISGIATDDIGITFTIKGKQTVTIEGTDNADPNKGDWSYKYTYYVKGPGTSTTTINLVGLSNGYKAGISSDNAHRIPIHNGDSSHYDVTYTTIPDSARAQIETTAGALGGLADLNKTNTSSVFDVLLQANGTYQVTAQVTGSGITTTGTYIIGSPELAVGYPDDPNGDGDTADATDQILFGRKGNPGRINQTLTNAFSAMVTDGAGANVPGVVVRFQVRVSGDAGGYLVFDSPANVDGTLVDSNNRERLDANGRQLTETTHKTLYVRTNASGAAIVDFQLGTDRKQDVTISAVRQSEVVSAYSGDALSGNQLVNPRSRSSQAAGRAGEYELRVNVEDEDGTALPGERVEFRTSDGTLDDPSDAVVPTIGRLPVDTDTQGVAFVFFDLTDGSGSPRVTAHLLAPGEDNSIGTTDDTVVDDVVFNPSGSSNQPRRDPPLSQTARLSIRVDGTGARRAVTVTAINAQGVNIPGLRVALTGTALTTSRVVNTGTTTVITLPTTPDDYTITATFSGYDPDTETLTVAASAALGTFSITTIDAPVNGQQTIEVTVLNANGARASVPVTVTLVGPGISRTVETTRGTGRVFIRIPTTTTSYTLTVSADGYTRKQETFTTTGQRAEVPAPPSGPAGEADSVEIDGSRQRSGTVNEELDAPLRVRVVDANDNGVEDVRVVFRVLSPGRGTFPGARGSGRATQDETDQNGYVSVDFTPISTGNVTVRATPAGGIAPVTFIIDVGEAADDDDPEPPTPSRDVGPSREISPVVHLGMASRPPMLWVDGGAIYALVGADVQKFAPGVDNALNITVGGGKVYWTEKTGESGGTINSANLNGSDVTELTSIKAVPMGIAVDVAGSKLYWTNSRGRIQSADLDGSGITNVMQNLPSPMDLALAGGNAYWTQGNGSVRFVNLRGQKVVRNVSTGTDTPGSLVIGGGKVYWTEMTGESGGTVNSANLNGTGATPLASILAAPMGIAVDGSRSKLYWTNSRGRVQSANLDGSGIKNVVSGLGSPGELVLSNSIAAPAGAGSSAGSGTTASDSKYDVNGDGTVDRFDALLVVSAFGTSNNKYDVNGDGTVNVKDYDLVFDNLAPGAAAAPAIVGVKFSAAQIDRIEEQIDLLIATNDRSPAALRTLIYLQQLLVTARPEKTQLLANYPNPFNPETWIPYELATDTNVKVTIYNTQGVVIRSLQLGHQSAGYYMGRDRAAYWDGRNALGEQVASGLYFYQLETDAMSLMRKMVILK